MHSDTIKVGLVQCIWMSLEQETHMYNRPGYKSRAKKKKKKTMQ